MLAPFFWFRGLLGAARDLQSQAFILESPSAAADRGYNCFAPPELENCASRLRCFVYNKVYNSRSNPFAAYVSLRDFFFAS